MIFCVFIDPDCLAEAEAEGPIAGGSLIALFQAALQNCFVAETKGSWRVGGDLRAAVEAISDQDLRKKLTELLVALATRNRFEEVIECDEGDLDTPVGDLAVADVENGDLDHLILCSSRILDHHKVSSLATYPVSGFSSARSEAMEGRTIAPDSLTFEQIFAQRFARLIRLSHKIAIVDYKLGHDFSGNYFENLALWATSLKETGRPLEFLLVTECKSPGIERSIRDRLSEVFDDCSVNWILKSEGDLPHERFLITPGFAVDIGRGVDLINPRTMKNRDLKIGICGMPSVNIGF